MPAAPSEVPLESLVAVAQRYGTPTYAYDVSRMRAKVKQLRSALPPAIEVLYSLKANPSLGISGLMAAWGFGADVASAGELATALAVNFKTSRISVSGPYKSPDIVAQLHSLKDVVLSADSLDEFASLSRREQAWRIILRLRPDLSSSKAVAHGIHSRFGIRYEDLSSNREKLSGKAVVGFHVFIGSQVLESTEVIDRLRSALDLCLRAAEILGVSPQIFNLGGGFGIPYRASERELDLNPIGQELARLADRVLPARIVLELGRYLVGPSGWYLTRVVANQSHRGRAAVVVDGGTHQRTDICGLGLRNCAPHPVIPRERQAHATPTDVLGCLCLPDDVLAESSHLPALNVGDLLAFPNAGAYGLTAAPALFLGHPRPAEVAFEGTDIQVLRPRDSTYTTLGEQQLSPDFIGINTGN